MKNYPKILMVVCLLKLLSWSSPAIAQETLPCLDSSKECVEELTEKAIAKRSSEEFAHSSKLKTLDDRIALIDRRLGVSRDSIDYAESKLWTNYLPASTSTASNAELEAALIIAIETDNIIGKAVKPSRFCGCKGVIFAN